MGILALSLFLYPIVVLGQDICGDPPFETCSKPLPENFLSVLTPQSVKDVCPTFMEYIACLGNYDDTCGEKAPRKIFPDEGEFESVRDVIADICDEDALLHTVLSENVQCLQDGLFNDNNNTCYDEKRELAQTMSDTQGEESSEYDEQSYTSIDVCFFHLYTVTCYLEFVVENCGILAKEAIIEVLHRTYFLRKHCHPEITQEFDGIVDKLEIREPLQHILKELISKIMKKDK